MNNLKIILQKNTLLEDKKLKISSEKDVIIINIDSNSPLIWTRIHDKSTLEQSEEFDYRPLGKISWCNMSSSLNRRTTISAATIRSIPFAKSSASKSF